MAEEHGDHFTFNFDGVAIQSNLRRVSFEMAPTTADVTAAGDTTRQHVKGKIINVDVRVDGNWDPASGAIDATLFDHIKNDTAAVALQFSPTGAAPSATNPRYDLAGSWCSRYTIEASIDDAVRCSAEFVDSGALTRTVA